MKGHRWTEAETAALMAAQERGLTPAAIARLAIFKGKRSIGSIVKRSSNEGRSLVERKALAKPQGKPRKCLCCPTTIMSEGPHHRLCANCRGRI